MQPLQWNCFPVFQLWQQAYTGAAPQGSVFAANISCLKRYRLYLKPLTLQLNLPAATLLPLLLPLWKRLKNDCITPAMLTPFSIP